MAASDMRDLLRRVGEHLVADHWERPRRAVRALIGEIDTVLRETGERVPVSESYRHCPVCPTLRTISRQPPSDVTSCPRCGTEMMLRERLSYEEPEGLPALNVPPRRWRAQRRQRA